jgi:poly(3-hydroxybutyrate) depolymerase
MRKELLSVAGSLLANAVAGKSGGQQGSIETRTVEVDSEEYNYQLYVPADVKNKEKLPVIIFLHGIAQRGSGGFVPTTGARRDCPALFRAGRSDCFAAAMSPGKLLVGRCDGQNGDSFARANR